MTVAPISERGFNQFHDAWSRGDVAAARVAIREHGLDHRDFAFRLQRLVGEALEDAFEDHDGQLPEHHVALLQVVAEETSIIQTVRSGEGFVAGLHPALVRSRAFHLIEAYGTDPRDRSLHRWLRLHAKSDGVPEDACTELQRWCQRRAAELGQRESSAHQRIVRWYAQPEGPRAASGFAKALHQGDFPLARAFLRAGGFSLREVHDSTRRRNELWFALSQGVQAAANYGDDDARQYLDTWLPLVLNRIAQRWKGRLDDFGVSDSSLVRADFVFALNTLHRLGCEAALDALEHVGLRENAAAFVEAWVENYDSALDVEWLRNRWRTRAAATASEAVQTRRQRRPGL